MFHLEAIGPVRGDETKPWAVIFHKTQKPTVKEFVDYLLTGRNGDWGRVYISTDRKLKTIWRCLGYKNYLEYSHGKIQKDLQSLLEKHGDKTIIFASADGGWTGYDYLVIV